ncbi:hypothetical protein ASPVEDRAFT_335717 [Aspergillus versicolor CBS 583.65]|uniref:Uncharacterized protein n=1 Tax=Aspergillus versicolor CBS 583.65 TaxID=1036611 RepID=A0A1L9PZ87_ASPVE|nr:uncharacterized protein ASPVEDRAFT_335717 [Aspergillus versicolor CBS 583.65]OJJ06775.1 hypothetical protein ASPVEDRAFT_335717 [Aspergillus versicolor CBS 583.65]
MSIQHSNHDDLTEDPNVLGTVSLFPAQQCVLHHDRVCLLRGFGFGMVGESSIHPVVRLNLDQEPSVCCHSFRFIVVCFMMEVSACQSLLSASWPIRNVSIVLESCYALFFNYSDSTTRLGQRQPISSCFCHPSDSLSPDTSGPRLHEPCLRLSHWGSA